MTLHIINCAGEAVEPYLEDLARLRSTVFHDYPYLYEGGTDSEGDYLAAYARSPRSIFVLALDDNEVVGAATGMPLLDDQTAFQLPFRKKGLALEQIFYLGESVLLHPYRGRGIGHRFFDEREAHARRNGFKLAAFCAVERDEHDPRRPPDYRPNDAFWAKRGYRRQHDLFCELSWRELGQAEPSRHLLRYWLRSLEH
ncbi:GNAT family N-acetyltransferase [Dyella flagellata]|uniref:N-acetyltransferase n=1 Tax=Dyella flagellata TaxID=1867833 RepID=A0ABQ5X9N6_9GAMM|nr:GNAT family N-acetyltransferase [Dyella flagellata]GLQ88334.1 N-acetyltransferase [Dyella flagellata]